MKKLSKMVLVILMVLLVFFPLTASAKMTKVFAENFAQENGEYPASFFPLEPGAVQHVDKGSFVIVGGGEMGFTSQGAVFNIPSYASQITCSYKMKSDLNMMTAFAFIHNGQAVQVQFFGETILASFGGEHDFMPVATNTGSWTRVIIKMDVDAGVYDLFINDVMVAESLSVSNQPIPVNMLFGTMGTQGQAALDNISVKVLDK